MSGSISLLHFWQANLQENLPRTNTFCSELLGLTYLIELRFKAASWQVPGCNQLRPWQLETALCTSSTASQLWIQMNTIARTDHVHRSLVQI